MIKVYDFLSDLDFIRKYEGLDNTNWAHERKALNILYNYLEDMDDETLNDMTIRDWLRFEVVEMTTEEIKNSYSNIFDDFSNVEDLLNYYSFIYGTYESNGETYYLFSEF